MQGLGYAVLPDTPVTPHTLFYAGSTTKSFTAAALSLLVDNSSQYSDVQWNTPISHILPDDFVLSDEWATKHITIEDALSHRTGYPRHDLAWTKSTRDLVRGLRHLPMTAEPRARYQYTNKMIAVVGYLIERLSGQWLGDFFRQHLFEPMGMTETYYSLEDAKSSDQLLAGEYHWVSKRAEYVRVPDEANMDDAPAGAIISTVVDYTKYLQTMMAEGAPLSAAGHRQIKTPRMLSIPSWPPFTGPVFYCLCWDYSIIQGEQVWFHMGQANRFVSIMIMVPSKQFSIVVFSNSASPVYQMLAYRALYDNFGVPDDQRMDFEAK